MRPPSPFSHPYRLLPKSLININSPHRRCTHHLPRTFTTDHLHHIRALLDPLPKLPFPPHTVTFSGRPAFEAAILIPLLNLDGRAHVLMEVRNTRMRVHAGEVSFPGGKMDPEDETIVNTALRETHEELGIDPKHFEILGSLPPEYSLGNKARVWPIVGNLHSRSSSTNLTKGSYDLKTLKPESAEVSALLPLPLAALQEESRRSTHYFRLDIRKPYHRFSVDDLILYPPNAESHRDPSLSEEKGSEGDEGVEIGDEIWTRSVERKGMEIWGLSGWFLNVLADRLRWLPPPPQGETPEGD